MSGIWYIRELICGRLILCFVLLFSFWVITTTRYFSYIWKVPDCCCLDPKAALTVTFHPGRKITIRASFGARQSDNKRHLIYTGISGGLILCFVLLFSFQLTTTTRYFRTYEKSLIVVLSRPESRSDRNFPPGGKVEPREAFGSRQSDHQWLLIYTNN